MELIRGTNFGNWLVPERLAGPDIFDPFTEEDTLRHHRDTFITEQDFRIVKDYGLNMIRLSVPCHIFDGKSPEAGCIAYSDKAMEWAERYDLKILLNLHTVSHCRDSYSKNGNSDVYNWYKNTEEVKNVLNVLERLAERYKEYSSLFGIEITGHAPISFLKSFYMDVYAHLRAVLPENKVIVFHDGFQLNKWNSFFHNSPMKNVALDTHIYIDAADRFIFPAKPWVYRIYINFCQKKIRQMQKTVPVIIGEWYIRNNYADRMGNSVMSLKEYQRKQRKKYQRVADMELAAWSETQGWFYWNYKLSQGQAVPLNETWKESLDLSCCIKNGWITKAMLS